MRRESPVYRLRNSSRSAFQCPSSRRAHAWRSERTALSSVQRGSAGSWRRCHQNQKCEFRFLDLYAGLKNGKPWMWSQCACVMKSESFIGCAWNSSSKARPSGRMPEPASSTTISPSARTSRQVVLPPYRSVPGPGTAIEPRVPQNLIRTGDDDAEMLGMDVETPILPCILN